MIQTWEPRLIWLQADNVQDGTGFKRDTAGEWEGYVGGRAAPTNSRTGEGCGAAGTASCWRRAMEVDVPNELRDMRRG
jgi:hypothetical protein